MRLRLIPVLCGLLLAFSMSVAIAPVFAQTAAPAPVTVSDAKLQSFVAAALKVGDLIDKWTPKIEAAPTPEEKTKLKQTANAELVAAIQSNGDMTLPEYRQISQAAEADPALQERIIKMLQAGAQKTQ
jgi:hypothetical protein